MKHNYANILWVQNMQGNRLAKNSMMFFCVLFLMFLSSMSVVGQNPTPPSYEWKDKVTQATVIPLSGETSDIQIAIANGPDNFIYSLSFGNGVDKRNPDGSIAIEKFIKGSNLKSPTDIVVNSKGLIFIADYFVEDKDDCKKNGKIRVFNTLGNEIGLIRTSYFRPIGIALDKDDNLYSAEYSLPGTCEPNDSRIRKFDSQTFAQIDINKTQVDKPFRIAVDSKFNVFVSQALTGNGNNGIVGVFDKDLNFIKNLSNQNIKSPGSLMVDADDFLHIIDYNGRLDFSKFINYEELASDIFAASRLIEEIKKGQDKNEYSIKIFDSNLNILSDKTVKDKIDFPIDLTISLCDKLYVNNSEIFGEPRFGFFIPEKIEFELEIFKRTPSFDTEKPEIISCVPDQTESLTNGKFRLPDYIGFAVFDAKDNCDTDLTITQDPPENTEITETRTITITATDAAGNFESCDFDVIIETVIDTEKPIITCPANISENVDSGQCGAVITFADATATDNSGEDITIVRTDNINLNSGDVFPVGTTILSFEATDSSDNTSEECSFTITITDNENPTISCPVPITSTVAFGETKKVINYDAPIFDDNCANATIVRTGGLASGSEFPIGITTNTFEVRDASDNTFTCSFDVTITENTDIEPPVISCPTNISKNTDSGQCGAVVTFANTTATDNSGIPPTITRIDNTGLNSGDLFPVGETIISFRATDGAGLTDECSFTITVIDNENPTISCPSDISETVAFGESGKVITYTAPTFGDNCAGSTITQTNGLVSGSEFPIGTTTNTFMVADASDNTFTCSFDITITENEETPSPTFDCPDTNQATVLSLDENCSFEVPEYSNILSNFENFENDPYFDQTETRNGNSLFVNIEVYDGEGGDYVGECDFIVDLRDSIPPKITCPSEILVEYTTEKTYTVPDFSTLYSSSDNCSTTLNYFQTPTAGTVVTEDMNASFRVGDENNNFFTCNFNIKFFKSTELQIINCPVDQTFEVDSNCSYLIPDIASTITTNIEGAVITQNIEPGFSVNNSLTLTITAKFEDQTDICEVELLAKDSIDPIVTCPGDQNETFNPENGFSLPNYTLQAQASDNCAVAKIEQIPDVGTVIFENTEVMVRIEDVTGNSATCIFNVVLIEDNTANTPPVALDNTYSLDQDTSLSIGTPGVLGNDTDADNDALTALIQSQPSSGTLTLNTDGSFTYTPNNGFTGEDTFTYVANDSIGNSNIATVTIIVNDTSFPNTAPIANDDTYTSEVDMILSISAPGVLEDDTSPAGRELTAVIQNSTINGDLVFNSNGSFDYIPNPGFSGVDTFTYIAKDGFEDSNVATVTIIVTTMTDSTVVCKESVNLELDENGNANLIAAGLFVARPEDLQFSIDKENFTCDDLGENRIILTYSNNAIQGSCEVLVNVKDVSHPTVNVKDITIALNEFGSITITPEMLDDGTTDNCGALSFSLSKLNFGCKEIGENIVNFTATDASGNSTSASAIVTVTGDCNINPEPDVEYIFIYPNPTSGPFQFAAPAGVTIQRVEVFDFRGRMILFKDFSEGDLIYSMDLTGVQSAVYVLKLFTSEGMDILRVIID